MTDEVFSAYLTAGATLLAALVTVGGAFLVARSVTAQAQKERDRQDKESEWREHAIRLTELDFERSKLMREAKEIQLPIITFLAFYRDLMKLDHMSVPDLYNYIIKNNIAVPPADNPIEVYSHRNIVVYTCSNKHQAQFIELHRERNSSCPKCSRSYRLLKMQEKKAAQ